jgi:glucose-1-phosphate adenylyltransferase
MPDTTAKLTIGNKNVLCVVLGGGQGSRLYPLTQDRSKPAVPLAGKYRLVDIPISNCINSGLTKVFVMTQFNTASLHQHITGSYKFDHFSKGFVEILAAEQTLTNTSWYQGTADAIRKNWIHLCNRPWDYMLILGGDQLYRMDFRFLLHRHLEHGADVTVATIPVRRPEIHGLGIMQTDAQSRIVNFVEKPTDPAVQDSLRLDPATYEQHGIKGKDELFLASMGIYVFNRATLRDALESPNQHTDFGKHIIPGLIKTHKVYADVFQGYWEDIGTIRSFFEANLDCTNEMPKFNFFDMENLIFSRPRYLPPSKVNGASIDHAIISDGCIINRAAIAYSVIGLRGIIGSGSYLHRTVLMGCDFYESDASIAEHQAKGQPSIGIGKNTRIENCIIDKNARIGDNVVINPTGKPDNVDHPLYYIRDGIVIIPKNAIIPDGTVI